MEKHLGQWTKLRAPHVVSPSWARHKTTETVLKNGWRSVAVGGGWWRLVVGGWRLAVLKAILNKKEFGVLKDSIVEPPPLQLLAHGAAVDPVCGTMRPGFSHTHLDRNSLPPLCPGGPGHSTCGHGIGGWPFRAPAPTPERTGRATGADEQCEAHHLGRGATRRCHDQRGSDQGCAYPGAGG